MASVFSRILKKELPAYWIAEDERAFAFLALDPIQLGHTLVVPKLEVNHWMDVPAEDFQAVQSLALKIGPAIRSSTQAPRVLTATVGFEVPHYHLHLIPAWTVGDLDFSKARRRTADEMESIQAQIRSLLPR